MKHRTRIAYLTSCRELGVAGRELVGRQVQNSHTHKRYGYRASCIEQLIGLSCLARGEFAATCEIGLILCDDSDSDEALEWHAAALWPKQQRLPDGKTVEAISVRTPSDWRRLPRSQPEAREAAKRAYERRIVGLLHEYDIDLLVVDSYRCVIGPTLLAAYANRIINIHPAVLAKDAHPLAGAFPTRDAYTRAAFGYVIVDDKRLSGIPPGDRLQVTYQGKQRTAVRVPQITTTGVTVHIVNEKLDEGPVLLSQSYTIDPARMDEEDIRARNYTLKYKLLPRAIVAYVRQHPELFPRALAKPAS